MKSHSNKSAPITLILTHHMDASHGWVQVPATLIDALGILDKITEFSYYSHDPAIYYLEEDCDAGTLIDAMKAQGFDFVFKPKDHGDEFRLLRALSRVGSSN